VADTGIGIISAYHAKVFESFSQADSSHSRKFGGTGLGLSISKGLVQLMGGEIWFDSEPDMGTRFYFTIPVELADKAHSEKPLPLAVQKDWRDFTVLIAEDEPNSYFYLELLLKDKVKRIDHAINGAEAVELALKSRYDLILMDLQMPFMDGIEATQKIKHHFADIPVIAQTAYASPKEKEKALQAGFDDYICKPVKKADLMAAINRVINGTIFQK